MKFMQLPYGIMKRFMRLFGLDLHIAKLPKKGQKTLAYGRAIPHSTYAPWLSDEKFQEIYNMVKGNTLVDQYRCYELWQLVAESRKLKGALIEIGVWRGGTGALIAKSAELNGIDDILYLCDTFEGVPKAGTKDSRYRGGEHKDTSEDIVKELINEKMGLANIHILRGIFPDETAALVEDKQFRFCHIDVDVYQSAQDIIEWIWPKIVVGGIIVYDDYGFYECDGITKFVNEERNKMDRVIIHNINGHAIVIKIGQS